jgi:serine/threonine protein kinase
LEAFSKVTTLNHPHIPGLVAAIKRGEIRYFIFSWADGGCSRDLWNAHTRLPLTKDLTVESEYQSRGLADAIDRVYNLENNGNISLQHGDLKPENILVFPDHTTIGNLKIGDWGLAKIHRQPTEERRRQTSALYGTRLYEPPEAVRRDCGGGRSRLYDIGSLRCMSLEHTIWLLYGDEEHRRFLGHLVIDPGQSGFYMITDKQVTVYS